MNNETNEIQKAIQKTVDQLEQIIAWLEQRPPTSSPPDEAIEKKLGFSYSNTYSYLCAYISIRSFRETFLDCSLCPLDFKCNRLNSLYQNMVDSKTTYELLIKMKMFKKHMQSKIATAKDVPFNGEKESKYPKGKKDRAYNTKIDNVVHIFSTLNGKATRCGIPTTDPTPTNLRCTCVTCKRSSSIASEKMYRAVMGK